MINEEMLAAWRKSLEHSLLGQTPFYPPPPSNGSGGYPGGMGSRPDGLPSFEGEKQAPGSPADAGNRSGTPLADGVREEEGGRAAGAPGQGQREEEDKREDSEDG